MSDEIVPSGDGTAVLVRVDIPDAKTQKCIVLNPQDTVWSAKQIILEKINLDLPRDILNYSLYLPPSGAGKLGKFLDDQRQLKNYVLQGRVPRLEMRYKTRDYSIQVSLSEKAIIKANSKANQKKMMDYIAAGSVKKVEKLLEAGLDPNFVTEDGNTPLGLTCGRNSHNQCITPLLSGGAHIDFRGKDGLTPMHRAAIGGNAPAIQVLLTFGALPNYRDAKGLTPVYHTAIMGDDPGACMVLLRHRAELGIKDQGGWTELHQTSKYGHTRHADLFIRYGADINAQNLVGNTPLHVAASHGQIPCAMLLLKRGADKKKINFSSQNPGQVAILCGHHQLSSDINSFSPLNVEPMLQPADYNPNARQFDQMFVEKRMTDMCPLVPPAENLVDSLTQEWEQKEMEEVALPPTGRKGSTAGVLGEHRGRSGSVSSKGSAARFPGDSESISSMDQDSTHSGSTTGTPTVQPRNYTSFHNQRERLYRAGPGRYVVTEDVEPQQPGDLPLRRGVPVEVVYIGKGGYWEGKSAGKQGWFPALAIKECTEEEELDLEDRHAMTPTTEDTRDYDAKREAEDEVTNTTFSGGKRFSGIKDIIVSRGTKGYGFAMRGVKATKAMKFHPTPQVPALQYVGNVDPGGSADLAGMQQGDFIIEVNGHNVTYSTHDEVVNIVRKSGTSLHLKIITPLIKTKSASTVIRERLTPVSTPDQMRRFADTPESPAKFSSTEMLASLEESPDRETTIQGRGRRLLDSPVLARIDRTGWDSSQDDLNSSDQYRNSSHSSRHIAPVQPSPSRSPVPGVRAYPILDSSQDQEMRSQPEAYTPQWEYNFPEEDMQARSATQPTFPPRDYPTIKETVDITDLSANSLPNDEEEDDSVFTRAIRERKEKGLTKIDPIQRVRAATMPEGEERPKLISSRRDTLSANKPPLSPTEKEKAEPLSFLERQLQQASKDRDQRMSLSRPRMKEVKKAESVSVSPAHNSLAEAVMRKIDSVVVNNGKDHSSSSEEDELSDRSPVRYSLQRKAQEQRKSSKESKGPPPVVKPKPLYKSKTVDYGFEGRPTGENPKTPTMEEDRDASFTWNVQLKKTPQNIRKGENSQEEPKEDADGGSPVNWKSVLKPTVTNGRASPLSEYSQPTGEVVSSTRQFRQARPSSPAELKQPVVAKVFEAEPTAATQSKIPFQVQRQHIGNLPQSSSEGISLYEGGSVTAMPKYYQGTSRESFDETYWEGGSEKMSDGSHRPSVDGKSAPEEMQLPPPIPMSEKRISASESIEELPPPPPPDAFVTLDGIDGGETSTDDIIPPPSFPGHISAFTTPPPLPNTSPPKVVPGSNLPPGVEFLVINGQSSVPHDIPSPIPSPLEQIEATESESLLEPSPRVVPPPAFGAISDDKRQVDSKQLNPRKDYPRGMNEDEDVSELEESDVPPPLPSEPPPPLDAVDQSERRKEFDTLLETLPSPRDIRTEVQTNRGVAQTSETQLESTKNVTDNVSSPVNISLSETTNGSSSAVPPRPPLPLTHSNSTEQENAASATNTTSTSIPLSSEVAPEKTYLPRQGYVAAPETADLKKKAETKSYVDMPIEEWGISEVCEWLKEIGLGEHCEMFEENEIMGEHLADLSKDELKELGIKKLGHMKTFTSKLSQYTK